METFSFSIYSSYIPSFKQAARELDIDLIVEPINQGDKWIKAHAMVLDLTSLVGLAFVAGNNSMSANMKNPFNDLMNTLEKKLDDYKKNNPDENR